MLRLLAGSQRRQGGPGRHRPARHEDLRGLGLRQGTQQGQEAEEVGG